MHKVRIGELLNGRFQVSDPATGEGVYCDDVGFKVYANDAMVFDSATGGSLTQNLSPHPGLCRWAYEIEAEHFQVGYELTVIAYATVNGISSSCPVYEARVVDENESLDIFLNRWTQNKMVKTINGGTGVITYTLRNDDDSDNYCHWTYDPATGVRSAIVFD